MPSPLWGQYERLRPAQIEAIRDATPVALLPWGALEWHSYHNPIGLDGLKAHGLLLALAAECGGVVLPPVFVGTDTIKPFKGFPHTIDHPFETVKTLIAQFLEQLRDEKFKVIVLLTGHYGGGQVKAVDEATEEFLAKYDDTQVWSFPEWKLGDEFEINHAAHGETSFQLYFDESLVDLSMLPKDRVAELDVDGVMGRDAREATVEDGRRFVEAFVAAAKPKVLEMLERARA